jgi:hypothetical protein
MLMLDIGTDLGDIPEDILELGNDPLFGSGGDMASAGRLCDGGLVYRGRVSMQVWSKLKDAFALQLDWV